MGVMRFVVDDLQRISDQFLATAYIASLEGVPWRCFAERTADGFQIRRKIDDSGSLFAMWRMPEGGEILLSTANLRAGERPYLLPVELARGTLNRLRNQTAAWRQAGLTIPRAVADQISVANAPFAVAATSQHDVPAATEASEATIRESLLGCEMLLETYLEQLSPGGTRQEATGLLFGANIAKPISEAGDAAEIVETFNLASVNANWAATEPVTGEFDFVAMEDTMDWAKAQGLKTMVGPILSFSPSQLPDWLVLWEDDFPAMQSYVVAWVREVVERFRGEVSLWNCSANMNSGLVLSLSDEQRLKLTVAALYTVRSIDPNTPAIISFDQPWSEYMTHASTDVAPLHYADALARADLGVAGLGIQIDWGYQPGGTLPRLPLELSQLLDQWSMLGLPLVVFMRVPSSLQPSHQAHSATPLAGTPAAQWNEELHRALAEKLVKICWSKQSVQGVVWNQTYDADGYQFPHAGLYNGEGDAKSVLSAMRDIRTKYIG